MKKLAAVFLLAVLLAPPATAQEQNTLAEVVQNQRRILQALEEIKQELAVIKVRATNG